MPKKNDFALEVPAVAKNLFNEYDFTEAAEKHAAAVCGRGCSLTSRRARAVIADFIAGAQCALDILNQQNPPVDATKPV